MVRAFILYYLNIKKTHGYEIQKFVQMQGTEQWGKIQSGSIYYALTKLEKEKFIEVYKEERVGARIRKIYQITESGKAELQREMAEELASPIWSVGSFKFVTDPMLSTLPKEECIQIIQQHIKSLQEQKDYWEKWQKVKISKDSLKLTKISFEMTIKSISDQILWHEELLKNLDMYIQLSHKTSQFIQSVDFDLLEQTNEENATNHEKLAYAMKLKKVIEEDPRNAIDNLNKIIDELTKGQ
ncbi:MAG: PadR family transcriptional regulator [Clostridiales bacterium]|nr:PadR family transcriptional regulator [Clostridiales bacterium]